MPQLKLFFFLMILAGQALGQHRCMNQSGKFCSETNAKMLANSLRSDSIDILHYHLQLDISDFQTKIISGSARIRFKAKMPNVQKICFDLKGFQIDSVVHPQLQNYLYAGELLSINFNQNLSQTNPDSVTIYYRGVPATDASWGGFYFNQGYAFNMGVAFTENPHNFGRAWFPCFDNFVERSTFSFEITTQANHRAVCNGFLTSENLGLKNTFDYYLNVPIPTYLASVAVAPYTIVNRQLQGKNGNIPLRLAAVAGDTSNFKSSLINIQQAVDVFEDFYGNHIFPFIGYVAVPFNGGAMEHATNIAYPRFAINGNLSYETLYAHELAHHWWGDNVTCETAGDMWLNEGWASYSEHLFTEKVYGKQARIDAYKNRLADVIQYTHHKEGGFRALYGIPHQYTYGQHVYDKGALVAHTLRTYLGDSLFATSIGKMMNDNQLTTISSYTLKNHLSNYSGKDLTSFFDDWVFQPGFPVFSVDSLRTEVNGSSFQTQVYTKQKLHGASNLYTDVPFNITFYSSDFRKEERQIRHSGLADQNEVTLPFSPVFATVNNQYDIAQAAISEERLIKQNGDVNFGRALLNINVSNIQDSILLHITHHFAPADEFQFPNPSLKISKSRFYSVKGLNFQNAKLKGLIFYDGRNQGTNGNGFLDLDLNIVHEDSMFLLYRPSAAYEWIKFPYYTRNVLSNPTNKHGRFEIDSLLQGDYTIAYGNIQVLGMNRKIDFNSSEFNIYPNPAKNLITVAVKENMNGTIEIYDMSGKIVLQQTIKGKNTVISKKLKPGNYVVFINENGKSSPGKKLSIID